jgi:hypothetical protein
MDFHFIGDAEIYIHEKKPMGIKFNPPGKEIGKW